METTWQDVIPQLGLFVVIIGLSAWLAIESIKTWWQWITTCLSDEKEVTDDP